MFQLSQKCDVHVDGQGNGHSNERRHYVINKSTIRVITRMKTRSLTGSVKASANLEAKYSCIVVAIRSSKRWEDFCVWMEDSDEISRGIVQSILRTRTRRQSNRRSTRSSLSPFSSSAIHCVVRSLWPLSARNIKDTPVNTYTNVLSLVVWWSELPTTNHEVPGSIPGSTMGIFLVGGGSPWWPWSG